MKTTRRREGCPVARAAHLETTHDSKAPDTETGRAALAPFARVTADHLSAWKANKLSATDRAVDVVLEMHANAAGFAWPSLQRIAEISRISQLTNVARSLRRLEKLGRLTRRRHRNGKGRWDRTTYTIIPWPPAPVINPDQWTSDQIRSIDTPTSDQIRSEPVIRSDKLKRPIEKNKECLASLDTRVRAREEPQFEISLEGSFELFWHAYPHKVGKGDARKSFAVAVKKVSVGVLIEGVNRYVATKPIDHPWCNPGTWLRQERWSDEYGSEPRERLSGFAAAAHRLMSRRRSDDD